MTSPRAAEPFLKYLQAGEPSRAFEFAFRLLHGGMGAIRMGQGERAVLVTVADGRYRHTGFSPKRGYTIDGQVCPICHPSYLLGPRLKRGSDPMARPQG